jgi:Zn-dependent protease with chaperone function
MNFFERQAAARRSSMRLIVLFALAVLGIVVAVDAAVLIALLTHEVRGAALWGWVAFASVATLAVIGLGSLYRIASLRNGGEAIALQLGGVPVPERTRDPQLRRLRNVVEEIAIASGVPVPKIYVLEREAGINAFAAGYAPSDAAIAVTRGALERLNRDELQGVIAHEFSHVLNGDMRLNIRLIGLLFGILVLAIIGRKILEHGRVGGRDDKGAGAVIVAALVAMAVGYIGLFFGRLIKAGVSRSRERLADASAVQFTRQTAGLAGALKKIAGLNEGAKLEHRGDAEEISHMLFGDGVGLDGVFATHPPLLERIQALEPQFRPDHLLNLHQRWAAAPPNGLEEDLQRGLIEPASALATPSRRPRTSASAAEPPPLPRADAPFELTPPMVVAQVAHPAEDDYRRADAIVGAMPERLRALAQQREDVVALILGLLLDDDARVQGLQHMEIAARLGRQAADLAAEFRREHLLDLHPMLRLPLAALAFPVLRQRPRPELGVVLDTVHAVVNTDGRLSAFEYCLGCLLHVQLRESLDPGRHRAFGRRALTDVRPQVASLLALIAQAGHDDEDGAKRAYLAGLQRILPHGHIDYAPPAEGMRALDIVWPQLDALAPPEKQVLIEAITAAIGHDGRIRVAEAELLRTVCGVLHCPLPPMLGRG